jgi:hypothetical protein
MMTTPSCSYFPYIPTSFINQPSTYWELPVRFLPPDNVVDATLISIINTQRLAANNNRRLSRSLSHTPNLESFVYPELNALKDPISSSVAHVLSSTAMHKLPEKIASLYMIFKALQWQIKPSLETYEEMPSWFSPRPSQLVCPHPSWVSQIKFPKLRDKVIHNQLIYANECFLAAYTASLCVNWPFDDGEIFEFKNGKVRVTDLFESHILKLENWSLTEPFTLIYPELEGVCRYTNLV